MSKKKKIETSATIGVVERTTYRVSLAALIIAILGLLILFYWLIVPVNVLQIKNNPVPVEKKQVKGEDVQILNISYCKNRTASGVVNWSLVSNKQVILLPPYSDTTPIGCNKDLRAPILLPPVKFNDTYHFHYIVIYQVNPLKTETVIFDSQPFMITGLDGK